MTSAFVALQRGPQVPAHGALKLSFSAQEWCGHTFENIRFRPEKSVSLHHSYFESSVRGLTRASTAAERGPSLALGPRLSKPRLTPAAHTVELRRSNSPQSARTDRTACERRRANDHDQYFPGGLSVYSRRTSPQPLNGWQTPWGEKATLLHTQRLPYWRLNSARGLDDLLDLGLNSVSSRLKRSP